MAKIVPQPAFLVDKAGLAKLVDGRGKEFIVFELLQNSWDENITTVTVDIASVARGKVSITVTDDSPEGFADLSHAYTLFAESKKKSDPTKRGRFNIGEKLVLALCEYAEINTTKGTVIFSGDTRTNTKEKRQAGTVFKGVFRATVEEQQRMIRAARKTIPPANIETIINGERLEERTPIASFESTLLTVHADSEGYLRKTHRKTTVSLYAPREGEKAMLYEMGIPVVETGDTWHLDISQKVPLNTDRDNVLPSFLQEVRTAALNHMASQLTEEQSTAHWIGSALEDKDVAVEAVKAVVAKRYGDKAVIYDPSDREGTKIAVAEGYTVIPPRAFNKEQWENVKATGIKPAGQVTPSPKPFQQSVEGGTRVLRYWEGELTPGMKNMVSLAQTLARLLIHRDVEVLIVNDLMGMTAAAAYGPGGPLYLNLARLGHSFFFDSPDAKQERIALLLHEYAHERVSDHLSNQFADEIAKLGARLALASQVSAW
jgi:hypothetical protein